MAACRMFTTAMLYRFYVFVYVCLSLISVDCIDYQSRTHVDLSDIAGEVTFCCICRRFSNVVDLLSEPSMYLSNHVPTYFRSSTSAVCRVVPLERSVRHRIASLGIARRRRGCRAGRATRARCCLYTVTESETGQIPAVTDVSDRIY